MTLMGVMLIRLWNIGSYLLFYNSILGSNTHCVTKEAKGVRKKGLVKKSKQTNKGHHRIRAVQTSLYIVFKSGPVSIADARS